MNGVISRLRVLVALGLAASVLGGCQSGKKVNQVDALFQQNRELQAELSRTRSAMQALESERAMMAGRIGTLEGQMAEQRGAGLPELAATDSGAFGGIDGVETIEQDGQIKVKIPGDVLFSSGKVSLKKTAEKTLDQIAKVIASEYAHNTIRIEGYTDKDPIRKSKWKDNLELSMQRAAAVHRHMQKRGIEAQRMEAVGLGQWHPSSSKAKSRRVDIVVVLDS